MKKYIFGIALLSQSVLSSEITFEVKAPFVELEERIEMQLTDEFVDSIRPFARNLGRRLDSLLERASELTNFEAEEYLVKALNQLVYESDIKIDEMLSREVLERAILIHRVLEAETESSDFGVIDMRIRLLTRAIEMAKSKYSEQDINFLDNKSEISYAAFGKEYIVYLSELNKSVFDASAQYQLQKLALQFYQYDLARDVNYESHATDIVEIHDSLPAYPDSSENDRSSIRHIRSLRSLMFSLDVEFPKVEPLHYSIDTPRMSESMRLAKIELVVGDIRRNGTISGCINIMKENLHLVRSSNDFENLIYPHTSSGSPNGDYKKAVTNLVMNEMDLFLSINPSLNLMKRYKGYLSSVEKIERYLGMVLPAINSVDKWFALVTTSDVGSPSSLYTSSIRGFAQDHMDEFYKLSPSNREVESFVDKYN